MRDNEDNEENTYRLQPWNFVITCRSSCGRGIGATEAEEVAAGTVAAGATAGAETSAESGVDMTAGDDEDVGRDVAAVTELGGIDWSAVNNA